MIRSATLPDRARRRLGALLLAAGGACLTGVVPAAAADTSVSYYCTGPTNTDVASSVPPACIPIPNAVPPADSVDSQLPGVKAQSVGVAAGDGAGPDFCSRYGGYALSGFAGYAPSFNNVTACGPAKGYEWNSDPYDHDFQCVELSTRYLWSVYGLWVHNVDYGRNQARQVHADYPSVPLGPLSGTDLPQAGDVLSMWGPQDNVVGHTAVVVANNTTNGNGQIVILQENASRSIGFINVNNYVMSANGPSTNYYYFNSFQWAELASVAPPPPPPPSNGAFVRTPNGAVYRLVGNAPLHITDCAPLGGCSPVTAVSDLSGFAALPADGTFVRGVETGAIYRFAGGAPLHLSDCTVLGCSPDYNVNQATIDSLDHMLARPSNGTEIRAIETGAIYRVAGGAPLYINDCTPLGGCSTVDVNKVTIDILDHLNPVPDDSTFIRAADTGAIYRAAGGAPLHIDNCAPLGGCGAPVNVTQATIDTLDHLRPVPSDSSVIRAADTGATYVIVGGAPVWINVCTWNACGSQVNVTSNTVNTLDHLNAVPVNGVFARAGDTGAIYRFAGGAPLHITDCNAIGGCGSPVPLPQNSVDVHDHMNVYPSDGTVLEGMPSQTYWVVYGGKRYPDLQPPPGAVVVNDSSMTYIPIVV